MLKFVFNTLEMESQIKCIAYLVSLKVVLYILAVFVY